MVAEDARQPIAVRCRVAPARRCAQPGKPRWLRDLCPPSLGKTPPVASLNRIGTLGLASPPSSTYALSRAATNVFLPLGAGAGIPADQRRGKAVAEAGTGGQAPSVGTGSERRLRPMAPARL
jgi:hypothetical protein